MWFRSLLDSLKSRPPVAGVGRSSSRPTSRPQVEALEDRFVPSAYLQTNLAADQPGVALVHDPELVDSWRSSANSWAWSVANGVRTGGGPFPMAEAIGGCGAGESSLGNQPSRPAAS
jgi:hypothetical protein